MYVPAENVDIYREEVLPLATVITPNQYEAELLSGVTILTEEDAVRACLALHSRYIRYTPVLQALLSLSYCNLSFFFLESRGV